MSYFKVGDRVGVTYCPPLPQAVGRMATVIGMSYPDGVEIEFDSPLSSGPKPWYLEDKYGNPPPGPCKTIFCSAEFLVKI